MYLGRGWTLDEVGAAGGGRRSADELESDPEAEEGIPGRKFRFIHCPVLRRGPPEKGSLLERKGREPEQIRDAAFCIKAIKPRLRKWELLVIKLVRGGIKASSRDLDEFAPFQARLSLNMNKFSPYLFAELPMLHVNL